MAITKITIKRANHERVTITTAFRLQVEQDTAQGHFEYDTLKVSGNVATVNLPAVESNVVQQAMDYLNSHNYGWLKTINHIAPTNGQFYLTGDACFSWIPMTSNVHTYVRKATGPNNTTVEKSYLLEKGGGIRILNMCSACGSCEPQVQMKLLVQRLKLRLNEIKDKNIYDRTMATARRGILRSNMMPANAACHIQAQSWIDDLVMSNMLLGQYATCVHMWNYIAARAHSRTIIENAAQDPSAILIRSKRAFPACQAGDPAHGTGGTIKCTIDVRRTTASVTDDDISVYVPPPNTEFLPFENSTIGANDATITYDTNDATHKTITTSTWTVGASGTYLVSVYILPFYYAELKDIRGVLMGYNLQPPVDEDPSDPGYDYHLHPIPESIVDPNDNVGYPATRYTNTRATLTQYVKYNTSDTLTITGRQMYDVYKAYPSHTNHDTPFRWRIDVKWTMTGLQLGYNNSASSATEYSETYYIEAQRPRIPDTGLVRNTSSSQTAYDDYKLFNDVTMYNVKPRDSR